MKTRMLAIVTVAMTLCWQPALADSLRDAINGKHRTEAFVARDVYRNPEETLRFFEVEPDQTVVEVWPGAGWYTEILAPYLQEQGAYYAAHFPENSEVDYFQRSRKAFLKKLADDPTVYSNVVVTQFGPSSDAPIAPPRTADRVLTFRNVHNWLNQGFAEEAFEAFYLALKPGGILGVVEHRAKPGTTIDQMRQSGYVTEAYTIGLAENAGFELVDRSDINANPKDSATHPAGVWTLPPTLRLGDQDRSRYQGIGESDRMTLKFRKPEGPQQQSQGEQSDNAEAQGSR